MVADEQYIDQKNHQVLRTLTNIKHRVKVDYKINELLAFRRIQYGAKLGLEAKFLGSFEENENQKIRIWKLRST